MLDKLLNFSYSPSDRAVACQFQKVSILTCSKDYTSLSNAPARIRKGQDAEALKRALCVASPKFGYTWGGSGMG